MVLVLNTDIVSQSQIWIKSTKLSETYIEKPRPKIGQGLEGTDQVRLRLFVCGTPGTNCHRPKQTLVEPLLHSAHRPNSQSS
jgi:hypothetical protein